MGGSVSKSNSSSQGSGWNAGNTAGFNGGINGNYGINQSGNTSTSGSTSDSFSGGSSQSSQNVWGAQQPFLQDGYGGAQSAFNSAMGNINQMTPGVQNAMGSALAGAAGGFGNQMGGGFASGLQGQVGENAYVNALSNDMISDAQKIKQQNLGGLDARAAAAGMSGSSGYRNQVGDMMNDVDEQTMQGLNQLRFNARNQGVQNQMNLAGMMDRNQQGAMGNLQNLQQGAMNMFQPGMMAQQAAGNYLGMLGGPTVLGNSSSNNYAGSSSNSSSNSSGWSNGMNMGMGMQGGYNYGQNYGGNTNTSTGKGRGYGVSLA
jgi:hypothetical protein